MAKQKHTSAKIKSLSEHFAMINDNSRTESKRKEAVEEEGTTTVEASYDEDIDTNNSSMDDTTADDADENADDDSSSSTVLPPPPPEDHRQCQEMAITSSPTSSPTRNLDSGGRKVQESLVDELKIDFLSLRDEDDNEHDLLDDYSEFSALEIKGADSIEIREAIEAIRKEASQIDAIMAVDQLKTLQSELEVVTKQFQNRSMEAEELRLKLEESEDRIAHLELERDLHQADATKLKQDLKTCVDNMFDMSLVEQVGWGLTDETNENSGMALNIDGVPQASNMRVDKANIDKASSSSAPPHSSSQGPTEMRILGMIESSKSQSANHDRSRQSRSRSANERRLGHRSPTLSDPGLLQIQYTTKTSDLTEDDSVFPLLAGYQKRQGKSKAKDNRQDVFRTRTPIARPRMDSFKRIHPHAQPHQRSRSLSSVPNRTECSEGVDREEFKEKNLCGLLRPLMCRGVKRSPFSTSATRDHDIAIMKGQISNLHDMMRVSLHASEKLRGRIATISKYYEGVIGKLQEQVVECKMEKNRIEIELLNQLSQVDLDRRMTVTRKDSELRRKDEEISFLKQLKPLVGEVDEGEV
jgi:hypothetical protein